MFARLAEASMSLDIGTLFVIATCVTALLGLFLLFAWMQDRIAGARLVGDGLSDRRIFRRAVAARKARFAAIACRACPTSSCSSPSA